MYIYVYIYIYICMCVHICIHYFMLCMSKCMYIYINIHVYIRPMHPCTVCLSMFLSVCLSILTPETPGRADFEHSMILDRENEIAALRVKFETGPIFLSLSLSLFLSLSLSLSLSLARSLSLCLALSISLSPSLSFLRALDAQRDNEIAALHVTAFER